MSVDMVKLTRYNKSKGGEIMEFRLKEGLLLGVSTAATQIEGGDVNSNWNDWFKQGKIKDGTDPATGNDHWEKWEEDVELMAQMGIQIYRFGIEWARLIPQPGQINEEAVERYRTEIKALKAKLEENGISY